MNNQLLQLMLIINQYTSPLLVGGCVRDMLIGAQPKDYDIVIEENGLFDILSNDLADNGWKVKEAGLRFNVLHVSKDGVDYEIAAFRNDGEYVDGKPAKVYDGDIETDASRRDFTVNALYYDPFNDEILDPTGKGLYDIESRTLRFVGKAKDRIAEDPMRVFRFYRFIQKGFKPNSKCLREVRTAFPNAIKRLTECGGFEGMREEIERIVM